MRCPRCATENAEDNRFCGRCGLEFAKLDAADESAEEIRFCHRHRREPTSLSCGRCGAPICHRCVVLGPAGPRCKACAKLSVPISARAVVGEAKLTVRRLLTAGPYAIFLYIVIASLVFGLVRGCMMAASPRGTAIPRAGSQAAEPDQAPDGR